MNENTPRLHLFAQAVWHGEAFVVGNVAGLTKLREAIDALRGIQRWGTGDMVEAAFAGFTALPPARPAKDWAVVFGMPANTEADVVHQRYRVLAMRHHPDRGGSHEEMTAVNAAYDEFKRERGLT